MSRSRNSRRGVQKTYPGVCRVECRVCQNFDRRAELIAPLALAEGEEQAALDWCDRWVVREHEPTDWHAHRPPAPPPLTVKLSDAAAAKLLALIENPPGASERLRAAMKRFRSSTA